MNRTFRAAEIAAAAVALCAALNFAAPSLAQDLHAAHSAVVASPIAAAAAALPGAAPAPAAPASTALIQDRTPAPAAAAAPAPAAPALAEPAKPKGYLAQIFEKAMNAIVAPAAAPAPAGALDLLVGQYEANYASDREQECLANAVYFESRGEPTEGQLAVAEVVLNRASSGRYPSDLCAVITQPAQFSFIRHGRFPAADRASAAWRKAVAIARIARGRLASTVVPSGCLWYHATYVSPGWGRRLSRQTQIGLHIFYS